MLICEVQSPDAGAGPEVENALRARPNRGKMQLSTEAERKDTMPHVEVLVRLIIIWSPSISSQVEVAFRRLGGLPIIALTIRMVSSSIFIGEVEDTRTQRNQGRLNVSSVRGIRI